MTSAPPTETAPTAPGATARRPGGRRRGLGPRWVLRRLGHAVLVFFLVYTLVFLVLNVLPGDPISNRLNDPDAGYRPEVIDTLRSYYGLDRPVLERFGDGLAGLLHGDLGRSLVDGQAVTDKLGDAVGGTLVLGAVGFVVAILLATVVAAVALYAPVRSLRSLARSTPSFVYSLPVYLVALVFIQVFSFRLGWVPLGGKTGAGAVLLPAAVLGLTISPPLVQVFVRSLTDAQREPHVAVARARGLSEPVVFLRHLLPSAALPSLTVLGVTIGYLMSGAVITETVFGRYGLGSLTERAVREHDQPVLLGIVMMTAAAFLLANLIVDLLYPILDPRIGAGRGH